jgi:hypothetical protein
MEIVLKSLVASGFFTFGEGHRFALHAGMLCTTCSAQSRGTRVLHWYWSESPEGESSFVGFFYRQKEVASKVGCEQTTCRERYGIWHMRCRSRHGLSGRLS